MNKNAIRNYAIWARNELITRVTQKAFEYGVSKESIIDFNAESINGKLLTLEEKQQRQKLISEVKEKGFDQVMEEVAYTWFNRFIALRYMEVNNYLPNRVRVFTNENNEFKPQLLDEAATIELDGLDKEKVYELIETNKHEELYKTMLLATCNDMHKYLPGIFETIKDYKVLLFPENLLRSESVLGRLICEIEEDSWLDQVQIIGWLYQFYNIEPKAVSQKKKKTTKDDIAAITQLFTPDWIVKYMVENSLGKIWLDGHQDEKIKSNWKYYLDETEQEPIVKKELEKIKLANSIMNPENIKIMDPCMGSGHVLVYAFDVLMQIYQSQGWSNKDAAKSIIINNIYGLDIDKRAYQLSYFAVMMKARSYNRRIFSECLSPNVFVIEESNGFNIELLDKFGDLKYLAERLIDTFLDAKEYGTIINVNFTNDELGLLEKKIEEIDLMADYGSLLSQLHSMELVEKFMPLLKLAKIMSQKYDVVNTNPPYLGSDKMTEKLKDYLKTNYYEERYDLYAVFIEKCMDYVKKNGYVAMITMHNFMFSKSFEKMRIKFLKTKSIINAAHLGTRAFEEISGDVVQTISFIISRKIPNYKGGFIDLTESNDKENTFLEKKQIYCDMELFSKLPNYTFTYSLSNQMKELLLNEKKIGDYFESKAGIVTGKDDYFLRYWTEVNYGDIDFKPSGTEAKYVLFSKGGSFKKWYGNTPFVIKISDLWTPEKTNKSVRRGDKDSYYKKCIGWSYMGDGNNKNFTLLKDCTCGTGTPIILTEDDDLYYYTLGFLNTSIPSYFLKLFNPTLNTYASDICNLPLIYDIETKDKINSLVKENINLAKIDYDSSELSWNFKKHPILEYIQQDSSINTVKTFEQCYELWTNDRKKRNEKMHHNQTIITNIFLQTYKLMHEIENNSSFIIHKDHMDFESDIKAFISYCIGCLFGRYSPEKAGIVYAGGDWNLDKFDGFIPDEDNIIPISDDDYFEDDLVDKFISLISYLFGEEHLEENLNFIKKALNKKGDARTCLRLYFLDDFIKDHNNFYQVPGAGKRPIYWMFESGKNNGFKALIYIHRYTPDLIARLRVKYIHQLQAKYLYQLELIDKGVESNTSNKVTINNKKKKLKNQSDEVLIYEEKIHHFADKMIDLDLDNGIINNYKILSELLSPLK